MRKFAHRVACKIAQSHEFHTTHGVAHIAYFVAVMAEGHGLYAIVGGIMVVFSLITVIGSDGPT
jgi:hypothetical protein